MSTSRQAARRARWQSHLRAALTERLPLKATALFLAFVLWIITSTREETEEFMPVRFLPGLDGALELSGEPPQVRALVRGLGREVLKLHQSPPVIRRTVAGDLPDTVTVELRPADVDLPPGVDARVLDVRPRSVTLTFRPVISRAVPVRSGLVVRPDASGRVAAGLHFDPESVTVVGARRGVARVRWLRTQSDTLPAREGAHTVRLDTAGLQAMGVRVDRTTVRVRITRLGRSEESFGEAAPTPRAPARATPATPAAPRADSARADSARPPAPRDTVLAGQLPREAVRRDSARRDTTAPRRGP